VGPRVLREQNRRARGRDARRVARGGRKAEHGQGGARQHQGHQRESRCGWRVSRRGPRGCRDDQASRWSCALNSYQGTSVGGSPVQALAQGRTGAGARRQARSRGTGTEDSTRGLERQPTTSAPAVACHQGAEATGARGPPWPTSSRERPSKAAWRGVGQQAGRREPREAPSQQSHHRGQSRWVGRGVVGEACGAGRIQRRVRWPRTPSPARLASKGSAQRRARHSSTAPGRGGPAQRMWRGSTPGAGGSRRGGQ